MKLTDSSVLVTGGAGAIGGQLCTALVNEQCRRIIVFDDLSSGYLENIPQNGVEFIRGSILDQDSLERIFSGGIDIVFHLAAHFANQNSIDHPEADLLVNGLGTLKILEYAKQYEVKKVIYTSSSCVYGNTTGSAGEDAPFQLDTPYAITKALGEQYCSFFHTHYDLDIVILRYFNSFGPGERPGKYRNVIPNFLWSALHGESLVITGTGEETRSFTYTEDIVDGTMRAARLNENGGEVYNIGSDIEVRIVDLAQLINRLTGNAAPLQFTTGRLWDKVIHRSADISKARRELGYAPIQNLEQQLRQTISWFKEKGII